MELHCHIPRPPPTYCSFPNIIFTTDQYNSFVTFGCIHEFNFVWLKAIILSLSSFECLHFPVGCDTPQPLGIEHGTPLMIEDKYFTASSLDQTGRHKTLFAASGRLNYKGGFDVNGGWKPNDNDNCWIQVQLGRNAIVSGVITQGEDGGNQEWVTQYNVMYATMDNSNLVYVMSQDGTAQVCRIDVIPCSTIYLNVVIIDYFYVIPGSEFTHKKNIFFHKL